MKLLLASDHNGVSLKKELMKSMKKEFEIIDVSPENYPTDDFPDYAFKISKMLLETENAIAVIICGTGVGASIAANKVKGIRCALVNSAYVSMMARLDDDANMMALAANMDCEFASECIRVFARSEFKTEEKYSRRKNKIIKYENGEYNEL